MTPIEVLTDETVDVGLIQSFIEKLPEKALQFGVRVLLALLVFAIGAQLIKLVCRILKNQCSAAMPMSALFSSSAPLSELRFMYCLYSLLHQDLVWMRQALSRCLVQPEWR